MKNSRYYLLCLAGLTLLITGCEPNGISNRINEKSSVFAALTTEQKQSIEAGILSPGFTEDMVYIALGKPNAIETKAVEEGEVVM
jgi:hypothetical protein